MYEAVCVPVQLLDIYMCMNYVNQGEHMSLSTYLYQTLSVEGGRGGEARERGRSARVLHYTIAICVPQLEGQLLTHIHIQHTYIQY